LLEAAQPTKHLAPLQPDLFVAHECARWARAARRSSWPTSCVHCTSRRRS
jgi:hypothetical protein